MGAIVDWQVQDLVMAILDMDAEQVALVQKATDLRRTQLSEAKAYENQLKMYVGDRVRITGNMQAKWQRGRTGRVSKLDLDGVTVEFDEPYYSSRTYRTTYKVKLDYALVTKLI